MLVFLSLSHLEAQWLQLFSFPEASPLSCARVTNTTPSWHAGKKCITGTSSLATALQRLTAFFQFLFTTSTLALKGFYLHYRPAGTTRDGFDSIFAMQQFWNIAAVSAAGKGTAAVVTTPSSDEKQRDETFLYVASNV